MRGLVLAVLLLCQIPAAQAAEQFDPGRVDRRIAEEPEYVSERPLYGLVVVGRESPLRIWMVLDQSDADSEGYNVLYADLNGNGDLTEANERLTAANSESSRPMFNLPDVTDAATGSKHTRFHLKFSGRNPATHMISMLWRGERKIGGGYPEEPDDGYMRFAKTPEEAPVIYFNGDGPFQFQRWYGGEFQIGGEGDFKVFLGQIGRGNGSFCAFQRHVLPDDEAVLATLIYEDQEGNQHEKLFKLKERC